MALNVQDGSTFCVCDEAGDVDGTASAPGFFAADTRFLSRSLLTLAGRRPSLLSSSQPAPYLARFVFRNPDAGGLAPNELSIERERFVGDCMQERIHVENHGRRRVETELAIELEADFADIFVVKDVDPGFDKPDAARLPPPRTPTWREHGRTAVFADEGFPARTIVHFSQPCAIDGAVVRFPIVLEHGETWSLEIGVQPLLDGDRALASGAFAPHLANERRQAEDSGQPQQQPQQGDVPRATGRERERLKRA